MFQLVKKYSYDIVIKINKQVYVLHDGAVCYLELFSHAIQE